MHFYKAFVLSAILFGSVTCFIPLSIEPWETEEVLLARAEQQREAMRQALEASLQAQNARRARKDHRKVLPEAN